MSVVLDSSITLGWVYLDETNPIASQAFALVAASGGWVPSLWRIEVANSLHIAVRRGRITTMFRDTALADLARLDIKTDPDTDRLAWTAIAQLADRYRLTVYDAAYVELAQRRSLPLGSLDRAMCDAARILGVRLIGD